MDPCNMDYLCTVFQNELCLSPPPHSSQVGQSDAGHSSVPMSHPLGYMKLPPLPKIPMHEWYDKVSGAETIGLGVKIRYWPISVGGPDN